MGLYIVATKHPSSRRAASLCLRFRGKYQLQIQKGRGPAKYFASFSELYEYVCKKNLPECEVQIDTDELLPSWLGDLAEDLLSRDLSLGLLVDNEGILNPLRPVLSRFGIPVWTAPKKKIEEDPFQPVPLETSGPLRLSKAKQPGARKVPLVSPRPPLMGSLCNASISAPIRVEESFHDVLMKHLAESKKSNADIYHKGGISKQVFSKIISTPSMIPTKATVLCLCFGLELRYREAVVLLQAAGYALSRGIVSDVIVSKYLRNENYDMDQLNSELNEYGCPILGWKPRDE